MDTKSDMFLRTAKYWQYDITYCVRVQTDTYVLLDHEPISLDIISKMLLNRDRRIMCSPENIVFLCGKKCAFSFA